MSSKAFYGKIDSISKQLQKLGHDIVLPNHSDEPETEARMWKIGKKVHARFKAEKFHQSRKKIKNIDAVLVLNFAKNGIENYIGGATFLEMYDAFMMGKKIFLWNDIPEGILYDEIHGFAPVVINGNLKLVK
jgi:hypothetical protein